MRPFSPPPLLSSAQVQTLLAYVARPRAGVRYRRERLTTPDGDFIDLDFAETPPLGNGVLLQEGQLGQQEERRSAPLVLLIHGLEGNSHSGYILESVRQLARRGMASVAINHRGCSGEPNRSPRAYHSGETKDLAFVMGWLADRFPGVPLGAVGFSLGANMLTKYLGERVQHPLRAGVVVSPPFDLGRGSDRMAQGFNQVYTRTFLRRLKRKTVAKAALYEGILDVQKVLAAQTLREFDDAFLAPVYGFRDADDYYAQASCGQFLGGVHVPTLVVRAKDDPFFDPADIPYEVLKANPSLTPVITEKGGHVGFLAGWGNFWAEQVAAEFLAENL